VARVTASEAEARRPRSEAVEAELGDAAAEEEQRRQQQLEVAVVVPGGEAAGQQP